MEKEVKSVSILLFAGGIASTGCMANEAATPGVSKDVLRLKASSLGMVIDNETDSATVFNANSNKVLGIVEGLGSSPTATGDCSISPDGTKGFFTRFNSSITVVDLTTRPPTQAGGNNPISIANAGQNTAITPDGEFLLVCSSVFSQPISVIHVASQTQIGAFNIGFDCAAIDVCSDGSVLVASLGDNLVRRLTLSASGVLTETGESLPGFFGLGKVACSPAATAGIVLNDTSNGSTAISFKLPGLTPVSNLDVGFFPQSLAINNAGNRVYFRNFDGIVSGFTFDQTTGALGSTPLFQVESVFETPFSGLDQLAVHRSDASLYVPEPGHVRILDAQTGATTRTFTSESLSHPTGICFGAATPEESPGT